MIEGTKGMILRIGVGLVLSLAVALGMACDASDTKLERWALKFTQPAIDVTAEQLYKEFVRDDETAAEQYSGRRVRITGVVFDVRDDNDFEPVVELDVGQDQFTFESLVAQFSEGRRPDVESWIKGDMISMLCYIPVEALGAFDFDSVVPLRMCQPLENS